MESSSVLVSSSIASPICQEGQSERTFLIFAFYSLFFPSFSWFLANFSLSGGALHPLDLPVTMPLLVSNQLDILMNFWSWHKHQHIWNFQLLSLQSPFSRMTPFLWMLTSDTNDNVCIYAAISLHLELTLRTLRNLKGFFFFWVTQNVAQTLYLIWNKLISTWISNLRDQIWDSKSNLRFKNL